MKNVPVIAGIRADVRPLLPLNSPPGAVALALAGLLAWGALPAGPACAETFPYSKDRPQLAQGDSSVDQDTLSEEDKKRAQAQQERSRLLQEKARAARIGAFQREQEYYRSRDMFKMPEPGGLSELESPFEENVETRRPTREGLARELLQYAPQMLGLTGKGGEEGGSGLPGDAGSLLREGETGILRDMNRARQDDIARKREALQNLSREDGSGRMENEKSSPALPEQRSLMRSSTFSVNSPSAPSRPVRPSRVISPFRPMTNAEIEARGDSVSKSNNVTTEAIRPIDPIPMPGQ